MTLDLDHFPRLPLGHFPTPLERLDRLSEFLKGPEIWIKRDDCTGLAFGGNKTRKLEFLLADARQQNADVVVTFGALQSNHVRQTIAACARTGLECHAILTDIVPHDEPAYRSSGNFMLDGLSMASLHVVRTTEEAGTKFRSLNDTFQAQDKSVYVIPAGGSSPEGVLGYVSAAIETIEQANAQDLVFDAVVSASATGGTQAGLSIGFAPLAATTRILGVNVYDKSAIAFETRLGKFLENVCQTLGIGEPPDLEFVQGVVGEGYGLPTTPMKEAVLKTFQTEGILLDPVYTGKAMAGLFDMCRKGVFTQNDKILFVHTGGAPGLFAYRDTLLT